jgi:hypothetical protein
MKDFMNNTPSLEHQYEYILYLDSDFVINAKMRSRSVPQAMREWLNDSSAVHSGVPLTNASFIFFSNAPYAPIPCTGMIMLQSRRPETAELLLEWWNKNISHKNFVHEYEQFALWDWMRERGRIVNASSYLHKEKQFPPCNDNQWLCHYPIRRKHPWGWQINGAFRGMLKSILNFTGPSFLAAVEDIRMNHTMLMSVLPLVEEMLRVSA